MFLSIDLTLFMALRHFKDIETYFLSGFADVDKKIVHLTIMTLGTCCPS
jgi:hypothetical protein